jgi:Spy/CpxP family protein refolding chaperone
MMVKKLIVCTFVYALLIMNLPAMAQQAAPHKTPEQRAERQTMWMQKNLALNEEQNNKVYDIMLKHARETKANRETPPGPAKRVERREIERYKDARLRAVLTGDQFHRYKLHEAEVKEQQRMRREAAMQEGRD